MDYMERLEKIRKQAEKLRREKGLTPEYLIHELYKNDSALSQKIQEKERVGRELTRDVYLETLKLHGMADPRESRIYKGLAQVHDPPKEHRPPEKKGPQERRRPL